MGQRSVRPATFGRDAEDLIRVQEEEEVPVGSFQLKTDLSGNRPAVDHGVKTRPADRDPAAHRRLSPARGIMLGLVIGLILWFLIIKLLI